MHEAGAEDLDPAGALARGAARAVAHAARHVHLRRRLGEREIARPEARLRLAEEAIREMRERGFQIDEGDPFIDRHPFELREHRRVRRVEEIAAVHVARREDANGRRVRLERAHLHRRGMRAQQRAALEVQRVVHVHRRMIGGEIQRAEVVPLRFRFGAGGDRESDLAEDRLDLLEHDRHGVLRAAPHAPRRHGRVERGPRGRRRSERRRARIERRLERLLHTIRRRARLAPLGRRQRAERTHEIREPPALATDERSARRRERIGRVGRRDHRESVPLEDACRLLEFSECHVTPRCVTAAVATMSRLPPHRSPPSNV